MIIGYLDPWGLGLRFKIRAQVSGLWLRGAGKQVSTQTPERIQKVDPSMGVPIKYPLQYRAPN